jgi:hypothetical protein
MLGWFIVDLLVVSVLQFVVQGTILVAANFGDGLVQDEIAFIINTHEFSLKDSVVFG